MARQSTALLIALVILSPITALVPTLGHGTSDPVVRSAVVTESYTSTAYSTYFGSMNGTVVSQQPARLQPVGFGFITAKGKCSQFSYPVTVTTGTVLNAQITANNPINVYLLPAYDFQLSPDGCSIIGATILAENNFTSYLLHWTAPSDGTFYLIFTGPNAVVILTDDGSWKPIPQTQMVSVATSTETNNMPYSATTTETYTTTTVTPFYLQPTTNYLVTVAAIMGLIAILLLFLRKTIPTPRKP